MVPATLAGFLLAGGQQAFAAEGGTASTQHITVHNKLSVDMTDGAVVNRQNVRLDPDPPKTIAAGDSGEFKAKLGDSAKNVHLKVQYTVGSETVEFGYKADDEANRKCFTDTPADISGSHNDCDKTDPSFDFSPK